jgi:hypothetical protein
MRKILTILAITGVVMAVYSEYKRSQDNKRNNIKIVS